MTYPTETVRLTRDQVDVLLGRVTLDYVPFWVRQVGPAYANVAVVDTVEESLPYTEGWLAIETDEWVANARAEKQAADEEHNRRVMEAAERVQRISAPLMERLAKWPTE